MIIFGQMVNLLENRIKKSWSILGTLIIWIIFSMSVVQIILLSLREFG